MHTVFELARKIGIGGPRAANFPMQADYRETDFSALAGKSVLALGDWENLTYSGRQCFQGAEPDARLLLDKLKQEALWVTAIGFACVPSDSIGMAQSYFQSAGWKAHLNPQEHVTDQECSRVLANSDSQILMHAGALIASSRCDAVMVFSGDGSLVNDIARYTARLPKKRLLYTCSVPGSTSNRILATNNPFVHGNVFIQQDVLTNAG